MSAGGGGRGGPDVSDGTVEDMLFEIIHQHYQEALDALPLEDMPALGPRLLEAGVCFGFADPVSNIISNTVLSLSDEDWPVPGRPEPYGGSCPVPGRPEPYGARCPAPGHPEPYGAGKRKRKAKPSREARTAREKLFSSVQAGDEPSPPEARTIAERSYEGLVTFLTSYFRYLRNNDALRYLYLARANLLVAVKLIERDRFCCSTERLVIGSNASKFALKCAALSARHPRIKKFLTCCFGVCNLDKLPKDWSRRLSVHQIRRLSGLLNKPVNLKELQNEIDDSSLLNHGETDAACIGIVPHGLTESLRNILLDKVHAVYVKAISRLPVEEFRRRHHRGFLKAGYCFGPFSPASNIIVNTIWYDSNFPAEDDFEVDMVVTTHIESRSLNGLVKLMHACVPGISDHDAMVYLLKGKLKIRKAIEIAKQEGHDICEWDDGFYKVAADAAYHPETDAYMDFGIHILPMASSVVISLLKSSPSLSTTNVISLSRLLSSSERNHAKSLEPHVELTKDSLKLLAKHKEEFFARQSFVRKRIEAALEKFEQTQGHRYDLQIICGENGNVGKRRWTVDSKCQYSHLNFWARSKDKTSQLFVAQFSNDEDGNNLQSFCYPVRVSEDGRCCYCELEGIRIIHPIQGYLVGGASDFEKIACEEHKITNDEIISHGNLIDYLGAISNEDYIYLDPVRDALLVREINRVAKVSKISWKDESKMKQEVQHPHYTNV